MMVDLYHNCPWETDNVKLAKDVLFLLKALGVFTHPLEIFFFYLFLVL